MSPRQTGSTATVEKGHLMFLHTGNTGCRPELKPGCRGVPHNPLRQEDGAQFPQSAAITIFLIADLNITELLRGPQQLADRCWLGQLWNVGEPEQSDQKWFERTEGYQRVGNKKTTSRFLELLGADGKVDVCWELHFAEKLCYLLEEHKKSIKVTTCSRSEEKHVIF